MTDIVERLRSDRTSTFCRNLMYEAADEIERLRLDAARYRWLRDNPWPPILEADILLHRNARWDAAIDASMKL